jgi:hypothetical protein
VHCRALGQGVILRIGAEIPSLSTAFAFTSWITAVTIKKHLSRCGLLCLIQCAHRRVFTEKLTITSSLEVRLYSLLGGFYSNRGNASIIGGTAGCVLASRLSEDSDVSVLLIERGHVKNNMVSRMPLLSQNLFWTDTLQVQNTIWSEPIHGANGRKNRLWAVNGIGGASRLNAMLWTRGCPGNYMTWSDMGLRDWAWDKVEPYLRRLEDVAGPLDKSQSKVRGHRGPIELRKPPYPFKWLK